jgi:hypothetical protein
MQSKRRFENVFPFLRGRSDIHCQLPPNRSVESAFLRWRQQFAAACLVLNRRCNHAALYQLSDQEAFIKHFAGFEKIFISFDPSGFDHLSFLQHVNDIIIDFFLMAQRQSLGSRKR